MGVIRQKGRLLGLALRGGGPPCCLVRLGLSMHEISDFVGPYRGRLPRSYVLVLTGAGVGITKASPRYHHWGEGRCARVGMALH